ncbi:MAG: hypothetical protein ABIJ59_12575 [Pseudomonadota bacterium]
MQNEIKKIIQSMDVKQDREMAESKALTIFKFGPQALDILVDLGGSIEEKENDIQIKKKQLRAIILSIAMFTRKKNIFQTKAISNSNAISLLCKLSSENYHSATGVLHRIGYSDSDIQKERLLSLPIVDLHSNDKEISLNEALEEIKTAQLLTGINRIKNSGFIMGYSKRHAHEIYRVGKTDFVYRIRKRNLI